MTGKCCKMWSSTKTFAKSKPRVVNKKVFKSIANTGTDTSAQFSKYWQYDTSKLTEVNWLWVLLNAFLVLRVVLTVASIQQHLHIITNMYNNWPNYLVKAISNQHPITIFTGSPSRTSIHSALFTQQSRATDRLTGAGKIDRNSPHVMHSMQPNNTTGLQHAQFANPLSKINVQKLSFYNNKWPLHSYYKLTVFVH